MPDKVARVRSTRRRRRHSHKLIALAIVVLALATLGGGTTLAYAAVKSGAEQLQSQLTIDLQAGQAELEAAKANLTQANKDHDAYWALRSIDHFAAAKERFLAAGALADNSQLLKGLEHLPSAGDIARSRHAAVRGIAAMGMAISDAGLDLATLDAELIKPSPAGPAGRTLLTVLDQAHTGLVQVRADFDRAKNAAAQVDSRAVPTGQLATFLKARDTIAAAIAGIDEFERLVPVLAEALGGNGPRTYLVEQVNPLELRAGGGFIGSYTLLRADRGTLRVIASGNSYDLASARPSRGQPGFIVMPGPLREVIPNVSWSFVDSNLFPDFPSNARAAMDFVHPSGTSLDAVIAFDYYTVSKMLEFTGPLAIPGYGLSVDASNFVQLVTRLDYAGDPAHKAILSALAGPLMERVSALPPDRWPALITALNGLAAERHLQAYFNNSSVEDEIDRVGWSGRLNLNGLQDYMYEVESNYAGSKANYYLNRRYVVALTRIGGILHHKVTVEFVNNTPFGSYERTYYHSDVRLYVSDTASSLSTNLTPLKYANPAPPSGTSVLDGWLMVQCCGSRGQAVFEYDTLWPASQRGAHQIYWQKQPGTLNDPVVVIWNGKTVTGDLGQDLVISLMPNGVALAVAAPAQATLPSLGLG